MKAEFGKRRVTDNFIVVALKMSEIFGHQFVEVRLDVDPIVQVRKQETVIFQMTVEENEYRIETLNLISKLSLGEQSSLIIQTVEQMVAAEQLRESIQRNILINSLNEFLEEILEAQEEILKNSSEELKVSGFVDNSKASIIH